MLCDKCGSSTLGYLEGAEGDVRHPDGWRIDTSQPGPSMVLCPACPSEHVFASNPSAVPETTPKTTSEP